MYIPPGDNQWNEMREYLENVYEQLAKANKGTLLGPPLWNRKTGQVEVKAEFNSEEEKLALTKALNNSVNHILLELQYLDDIPQQLN